MPHPSAQWPSGLASRRVEATAHRHRQLGCNLTDAEVLRCPPSFLQVEGIKLRRPSRQKQENAELSRSSPINFGVRKGLERADHGQEVKPHEASRPNLEEFPAPQFGHDLKFF